MPLKLAIFDCDGTLVDSQASILISMAACFTDHGLTAPPDDAIRGVIGLTLADAIARLAPDRPSHEHAALADRYRHHAALAAGDPDKSERVFAGIADTLDRLDAAGVLLTVATGRGRRSLNDTLARPPLANRFVASVTPDEATGKPAPDMVLRLLAQTGVAAGDAVVIGDTDYDVTMARRAGVPALGVSWGYHPTDRLLAAGAVRIVERPAGLADAVLRCLGMAPAGLTEGAVA